MKEKLEIEIKSLESSVALSGRHSNLCIVGIVANTHPVVDDSANSLNGVECKIIITRQDPEDLPLELVGTCELRPNASALNGRINADPAAFDRIQGMLANVSTAIFIDLDIHGFRATDENGGTLEWENPYTVGAQVVRDADVRVVFR